MPGTLDADAMKEVSRRAHQIYDEQIRAQVEPAHIGKFIAVDVDTGEWEMDADMLVASKRLKTERRESVFLLRVGYPAAVSIGYFPLRPRTS
ncbi:MAG: hypothetical protein M3347_19265 [Armatimonadota bacterium]|nr:hypothetical protein [Armatimonadota bacterium]